MEEFLDDRYLRTFINKLDQCQYLEDYIQVFNKENFNTLSLRQYYHFEDDHYSRILLHNNSAYELLMICWSKNQKSAIHDHSKSECVMCCIEGKLVENRYTLNTQTLNNISTSCLEPNGDVVHINNIKGFHSINSPYCQSISLHLYLPSISDCHIYDEENNAPVRVKNIYDVNLMV